MIEKRSWCAFRERKIEQRWERRDGELEDYMFFEDSLGSACILAARPHCLGLSVDDVSCFCDKRFSW